MKVMLLNGSPHEKGCTFTSLCEVAKTIREAGIETEIFWIGNKPVRDCIACGGCSNPEAAGCIFQDDVCAGFLRKMHDADALIVGSPVYYAGPAGSLCSLLDRAFYSSPQVFARKPAACIVNCRRGGASAAFDRLNKYFTISQMPVVSSQYWNDTHGLVPEDVLQDTEGLRTMRTLGRNMAHFLQSQAKAALPPPEEEPRVATNFIQRSANVNTLVPPPNNPFFTNRKTKRTANFFWEKGYEIIDCTGEPEDDKHSIAKQLSKCHTLVRPLLKLLYANEEFTYPLDEFNHDDKNTILNLCKSLSAHGWLEMEISREKDSVQLHQLDAKKHRMFYNGGWAEMVTRYLILKELSAFGKAHKISYKILQNIKMKKINPVTSKTWDIELDIVVDLGNRFYIFETKSGCILSVDKWIDRARMFGTEGNRFILCCTNDKIDHRIFQPYKFFSLQNLEKQLENLLLKDFPDSDTQQIQDTSERMSK